MRQQKSFFTRVLVGALILSWIIGISTVIKNNTKKAQNTHQVERVELSENIYENVEIPNDSSIIYILRDTVSKHGSLMRDLRIDYATALQIAKREKIPLVRDRNGKLQPIVHEGDVFVYYRLCSGESGYFKDCPEYLCMSFD